MEEIWKDIFGYEGIYQISNMGRIKSMRKIIFMPNGNKNRVVNEKIHLGCLTKKGYYDIKLTNDIGVRKNYKVHRLVAQAFLPNVQNKPQINHIDCDKGNNHISNLEWCTNGENQLHAYKNGKKKSAGEKHGLSKLNPAKVIEIRKRHDNGEYIRALAREFNISKSSLTSVVKRVTWNYI